MGTTVGASEAVREPAVTRGWTRTIAVLALVVLLGAGIGVTTKAAGVRPARVLSESMSPAIHRGDWVVIRELGQGDRHAIGRGEIVLFRFPLGTEGRAVKRVVALGGDEVAIGARRVTVAGRLIPIAGAPSEGAARQRVETVPAGHVFLLGDNAASSIDSRSMGAVPETELVGRVLFVLPKQTVLFVLVLAAVALIAGGLLATRYRRRNARSC